MSEVKEEPITGSEAETPASSSTDGRAPDSNTSSTRGGSSLEPKDERRLHPLVELTLARIHEFLREPEVIFWVFAFPILLVCALGIAFRNTGPEKIRVAVERGAGDAA